MRKTITVTTILLTLSACSGSDAPAPAAVNEFDHIMVGIAELDAGMEILADLTGVTPAHGGIHPGRDTRNALLSLGGGTYFELIAPQANLQTITDPIALATLAYQTPTPMHWAVRTTDIEATKAMVESAGWTTTPIDARSRQTPDGGLLSWQMFFVAEADDAASIPFFIQWDAQSQHPSQTSPDGCTFDKLTISTPETERIDTLLDTLGLAIEIQASAQDSLALEISCGGSTLEF